MNNAASPRCNVNSWEIGGDYDQGREEDRPRHLTGRRPHVLLGQFLRRFSLATSQDVLGHHDCAVDDHAKVQRAERQHAGGHVTGVHQDENRNHSQRNGHRDHQRAARTAEKEPQHDDHEADPLDHRMADLAHGRGDEVATVENRDDVDVLGLELLLSSATFA